MDLMLMVRGGQVNLDTEEHNATAVRHRIQAAKQARKDYELGNGEEFYTSGDKGNLRFKLEGGGEVFFDTDDVFGVMQVGDDE